MSDSTMSIEKMNGRNFTSWKYNVKLLLMNRGLWNIVNKKEKRPPTVKTEDEGKPESVQKLKDINEWDLRADKAYSIIAINIVKELQIHILSTIDPAEAWDILNKQFALTSIQYVVRLSRRFYTETMSEDEDMNEFLTRMTTMAQELSDLKVSPTTEICNSYFRKLTGIL